MQSFGFVETPNGRNSKVGQPSHYLMMLFRILPKLIFDKLVPLFKESMDEVAELCALHLETEKEPIDSIKPHVVANWLYSKTSDESLKEKKAKFLKYYTPPTTVTNIAKIKKERKGINFCGRLDMASGSIVNLNKKLEAVELTKPLHVNDFFGGVLGVETHGNIDF